MIQRRIENHHIANLMILLPFLDRDKLFAVGMPIAEHPPHRSEHARFTHKMGSTPFYAKCGQDKNVVPSPGALWIGALQWMDTT